MAGFGYEGGKTETLDDGTTIHLMPEEPQQPEIPESSPASQTTLKATRQPSGPPAASTPEPQHRIPVTPQNPHRAAPQPTKGVGLIPSQQIGRPVSFASASLVETAPLPPIEVYVQPEAQIDNTPARSSRGHRKLGAMAATVALGLVGGGAIWLSHESNQHENTSPTTAGKEQLAPDSVDDMQLIPGESQPSPTDSTLVTPEPSPTTPTTPDAKTPTATPPSTSKTTGKKSSPKAVVPPATKPQASQSAPAPTRHNTTPTPTKTTPEQAPRGLNTAPNGKSIDLLSKAADKDKARELSDQYQNFGDFLQAPQSGELDFLSRDTVNVYQGTIKTVYSNSTAHNILGNPRLMNENSLSNHENPAPTVVSFSDIAVDNAGSLFQIVGDNISKTAYINPSLSSELTSKLQNQEDVSISSSSNEAVVGEVQKIHDIAVVPVVANYYKDSTSVTVARWDVLVPVDNAGNFVAVTAFEQTLQPNSFSSRSDTMTPEPTPTDTPTPDNTPFDGFFGFFRH